MFYKFSKINAALVKTQMNVNRNKLLFSQLFHTQYGWLLWHLQYRTVLLTEWEKRNTTLQLQPVPRFGIFCSFIKGFIRDGYNTKYRSHKCILSTIESDVTLDCWHQLIYLVKKASDWLIRSLSNEMAAAAVHNGVTSGMRPLWGGNSTFVCSYTVSVN